MSKEYLQLLERQEWENKRLEILQRDAYQCQICLNKNIVLQVHHTYYEKDKNPWEYPNDALITLCEFCHEKIHMILGNENSAFLKLEDRLRTIKNQQGNIDSAIKLITSQIITREQI